MIAGIGTDIVEVERIAKTCIRFGKHFEEEILRPSERASLPAGAEHLAGRWAAKEAVAKALGCGFGSECAILDIEILNSPEGVPCVTLYGKALERMLHLKIRKIHVSISHEKHYASATAVAEA